MSMSFGKRISASSRVSRIDSDTASLDDCEDGKQNHKRVNRNLSEKKRRDQFNMLVHELCSMVSSNNSKKMDKSTVLKSTISYLRNYQETAVQAKTHEIKENWKPSFLSNDEFMHLMLEALDSFLLVFNQQGNIVYTSESVTSLLGHLPGDLINQQVYDFIEDKEKSQLYNLMCHVSLTPENLNDNQVVFNCHFKRGSLDQEKSPVYESVKFTGFKHWNNFNDNEDNWNYGMMSQVKDNTCFCCTIQLENAQFIREMSIVEESKSEFTSRHSLEWKFLYLDHRASPIIGYLPFEVLGTSGYDYYHPDDLECLSKCHEQLMQKGEETSTYYRFLTKGQQWIWLRTRYYITYHQWNSKPEFVVCTNVVVSYADVRDHVWKEMGYNTANGNIPSKRERSPSVCSVTSGPNLSSCHSVGSASSDRGVGSQKACDNDNSPSSSVPTSKYIPQTVSQHLQLLLQHKLLQQQPVIQSQSGVGLQSTETQGTVVQTPTSSSSQMSSEAAVTSPQLFLTPVQRQLYHQLQEKSQQLQQAILRQQTELQQITQQLNLAKQGALPIPVMSVSHPVAVTTVPCVPSPVMFTTAGMLPPIQPILPLQPVTLPADHIIPFHHHLVPQDTIEDSSNIQNQS